MKRLKRGFTLIELLIVIAIIIILTAIIVPTVSVYTKRAKEAVCLANRRTLYSQVMMGVLMDEYSEYLDAFNEIYDPDKYICPLGGEFSWVDESESGRIICSHEEDASGGETGSEDSGTATTPPETSTAPPETSTAPPETSTVPPETSTAPPETSTVPPETSTSPSGAGITVYDAGGNAYTITPTQGVWEKIENNEMLAVGTVFYDETGAVVVLDGWNWQNTQDIKNMTVAEFAAKNPSYVNRLEGKILVTQSELDAAPDRPAGTLCLYDGKYYYARTTANQWNKPPQGVWFELL